MRSIPVIIALCSLARVFAASSDSTTAIDRDGNVWRTGESDSVETTATAFQKTAVSTVCATEDLSPFQSPTPVYCKHAYLIKQDPSGRVLYATYLGGSSQDGAIAITTDTQGNVYVAGYTYSSDFPVTAGAAQAHNAGPLNPVVVPQMSPFGPVYVAPGGDTFVAKFSSAGTLIFSTLVGGSGSDVPNLIATDSSGNVYVSGNTASSDFPLTPKAVARVPGPFFFTRLTSTEVLHTAVTSVTYSSYSSQRILAFDIDDSGRAILTGDDSAAPYVTIIDVPGSTGAQSISLTALDPKIVGAGVAIAVTPSRDLVLAVSPAPVPSGAGAAMPPFHPLGQSYLLRLGPDAGRVLAETAFTQARFDSVLLDASGNAFAFGAGTGALPAAPNPLLASACAPDGRTFVVESDPVGTIVNATYFRQGDDTAVALTSTGHIAVYRSRSSSIITLDLTSPPKENFGCPVNLASGADVQGIAPGETVALTGSNLGPDLGISGQPDASGRYPTTLAGVQVLFNSVPAPLLYVQANEIHAVAPFALANLPTVEVRSGSQTAPPLDLPRATYDPGIFSVNGVGAILNQDGTPNSPGNPAVTGSVVSIYATGLGTLMDSSRGARNPLADGEVTPIPPPFIVTELAAPQVTFADVPGNVLWSGSAPGIIAGVVQVNVQLPSTLPTGTVPVRLGIGPNQSPPVSMSVN